MSGPIRVKRRRPSSRQHVGQHERDVRGFHAIFVGGGIDPEIRQGSLFKVIVHAEAGNPEDLESVMRRDSLDIRKSSLG